MALTLEKEKELERTNKPMLDLIKKASLTLEKENLKSDVYRVVLVLDISGSMNGQFSSGQVQKLAERALALGANLDDNAEVELYLFGIDAHSRDPISLDNINGVIDNLRFQFEGGTRYAPVMDKVRKDAKEEGYSSPTLVLFITDGDNSDKAEATHQIVEASYEPIFWKFMAISSRSTPSSNNGGGLLSRFFKSENSGSLEDDFPFLQKLDTLSNRKVDNANFFAVDKHISLSDDELFAKLVEELGSWKQECKKLGILK